jgi:glycosyltransferase involved in cell wall biosynthesis
VVSAVGGLSEIINDEVTGLTFPPLDAGALADRLAELLRNPDRRAALGARAREWVARDRTWAHNATRYRTAYERLGAV